MLNCHMFSGTNYVQKSGTAWTANCKYEYYYFNRDIFALFIQYSYHPYIPETDILGWSTGSLTSLISNYLVYLGLSLTTNSMWKDAKNEAGMFLLHKLLNSWSNSSDQVPVREVLNYVNCETQAVKCLTQTVSVHICPKPCLQLMIWKLFLPTQQHY